MYDGGPVASCVHRTRGVIIDVRPRSVKGERLRPAPRLLRNGPSLFCGRPERGEEPTEHYPIGLIAIGADLMTGGIPRSPRTEAKNNHRSHHHRNWTEI